MKLLPDYHGAWYDPDIGFVWCSAEYMASIKNEIKREKILRRANKGLSY